MFASLDTPIPYFLLALIKQFSKIWNKTNGSIEWDGNMTLAEPGSPISTTALTRHFCVKLVQKEKIHLNMHQHRQMFILSNPILGNTSESLNFFFFLNPPLTIFLSLSIMIHYYKKKITLTQLNNYLFFSLLDYTEKNIRRIHWACVAELSISMFYVQMSEKGCIFSPNKQTLTWIGKWGTKQ